MFTIYHDLAVVDVLRPHAAAIPPIRAPRQDAMRLGQSSFGLRAAYRGGGVRDSFRVLRYFRVGRLTFKR